MKVDEPKLEHLTKKYPKLRTQIYLVNNEQTSLAKNPTLNLEITLWSVLANCAVLSLMKWPMPLAPLASKLKMKISVMRKWGGINHTKRWSAWQGKERKARIKIKNKINKLCMPHLSQNSGSWCRACPIPYAICVKSLIRERCGQNKNLTTKNSFHSAPQKSSFHSWDFETAAWILFWLRILQDTGTEIRLLGYLLRQKPQILKWMERKCKESHGFLIMHTESHQL